MKAFIRYSAARAVRDAEELSYRTYVTDQLRLAPRMMYMGVRWYDVVRGTGAVSDDRTVDEIVDGVMARFGEQT